MTPYSVSPEHLSACKLQRSRRMGGRAKARLQYQIAALQFHVARLLIHRHRKTCTLQARQTRQALQSQQILDGLLLGRLWRRLVGETLLRIEACLKS